MDRETFNLGITLERLTARTIRIEKTLVAIYDALPGFIQATIADRFLDDHHLVTVKEALKEMHDDTVRFDEAQRI
jgi:hypothetical protein